MVGTHALFQKSVGFSNLALIIIDEQHRFGVNQRLALRKKNDSEKSFKMLRENGIILWHDFVPGKESANNVVK